MGNTKSSNVSSTDIIIAEAQRNFPHFEYCSMFVKIFRDLRKLCEFSLETHLYIDYPAWVKAHKTILDYSKFFIDDRNIHFNGFFEQFINGLENDSVRNLDLLKAAATHTNLTILLKKLDRYFKEQYNYSI